MSAIVIANAQQLQASDPAVSAFVAASAGSGKTKLLTDRLLRLMLAGTAPEKILCLTYTKAAAAEMRIRLNKRLGEWVVKEDAALRADLAALNVPASAATLALARQLFAQVLDLPGGMRIETIHAFCQSLLRRFPLEAGLSPHFEVADDEQAARRLREAREAALADPGAREAVRALAAQTNEQDFAELTQQFVLEAPVALLNGGIGLDQLAAQQRGLVVVLLGFQLRAEIPFEGTRLALGEKPVRPVIPVRGAGFGGQGQPVQQRIGVFHPGRVAAFGDGLEDLA